MDGDATGIKNIITFIIIVNMKKVKNCVWIFKFRSKFEAAVFTSKILCPACVLFKQRGEIGSNGVKHNEKDNNIIRNEHSNTVGKATHVSTIIRSIFGDSESMLVQTPQDLRSGFALILSVVF